MRKRFETIEIRVQKNCIDFMGAYDFICTSVGDARRDSSFWAGDGSECGCGGGNGREPYGEPGNCIEFIHRETNLVIGLR